MTTDYCLEAKSAWAKYEDDVKAGHTEAAQYWKGQAEVYGILCAQQNHHQPVAVSRGAHDALRKKLIQLKTDIEEQTPELEGIYRESLEAAIAHAKQCNLYEAIETYSFAQSSGHKIIGRIERSSIVDFFEIEDLARKAIIEALTENCQCELEGG